MSDVMHYNSFEDFLTSLSTNAEPLEFNNYKEIEPEPAEEKPAEEKTEEKPKKPKRGKGAKADEGVQAD